MELYELLSLVMRTFTRLAVLSRDEASFAAAEGGDYQENGITTVRADRRNRAFHGFAIFCYPASVKSATEDPLWRENKLF